MPDAVGNSSMGKRTSLRRAAVKFWVWVAPVNSGFAVLPATTRRITAGLNSPPEIGSSLSR